MADDSHFETERRTQACYQTVVAISVTNVMEEAISRDNIFKLLPTERLRTALHFQQPRKVRASNCLNQLNSTHGFERVLCLD